jgi:hypothetical protein
MAGIPVEAGMAEGQVSWWCTDLVQPRGRNPAVRGSGTGLWPGADRGVESLAEQSSSSADLSQVCLQLLGQELTSSSLLFLSSIRQMIQSEEGEDVQPKVKYHVKCLKQRTRDFHILDTVRLVVLLQYLRMSKKSKRQRILATDIAVWIHIQIFYSLPLVFISVFCLYHAVSITMAL